MSQPILGREERTVAIKCEYREGDTVKAEVNTINRAELAAIKVALEVALELLLLGPRSQTNPEHCHGQRSDKHLSDMEMDHPPSRSAV
jgi:hypothetical protein